MVTRRKWWVQRISGTAGSGRSRPRPCAGNATSGTNNNRTAAVTLKFNGDTRGSTRETNSSDATSREGSTRRRKNRNGTFTFVKIKLCQCLQVKYLPMERLIMREQLNMCQLFKNNHQLMYELCEDNEENHDRNVTTIGTRFNVIRIIDTTILAGRKVPFFLEYKLLVW